MEWIPGKPEGRRLRTPAMGPRLRFLLAVLSLALIAAGAGCGGRARPVNVLLIVVDTLRADHLGSHGYPRGTSPNVDALARRSVVFPEAMSTAPWTLPSFSSLFTSRLPADHGMTGLDSVLREEEVTLAEALKAAGYRTGAFVNNALLRPKRGVAQGFDTFEEYSVLHAQKVDWNPRPPLPQVESWLDADRERPFFLMVHFIEPHAAYFPTGELAPRWVPDSLRHAAAIFPAEGRIAVRTPAGATQSPVPEGRRTHAIALYDMEILEVDLQIGRLLDALAVRGLSDDTVVVLISDHGEELWDHGDWGHGQSLHGELIRVPLVILPPRRARISPRTDPSTVSLLDVAPTLLAAAGVELPPSFEGRALDLSREAGSGPVWSDATRIGPARRSYLRDGWKLDLEMFAGAPSLYDTIRDPGEQRDLATSDSALVAELAGELLGRTPNGAGGWRVAMRGTKDADVFDGTFRTSGSIVRVWPHRLVNLPEQENRDTWKESANSVEFHVVAGSGAPRGLMICVDPPDAPISLELRLNGQACPDLVQVGRDGTGVAGPGPWAVAADSALVPLGHPPAKLAGTAAVVAVWNVPSAPGDVGAPRMELDEKTREELRALGYVR